jgi:TrmH family RNA methyltransferase
LLTAAQRDRVEIVLVSPRNPLNIGAAARAMANFGFSHLTVAAPYAPHWREARSAIGAPELLEHATEAGSLAEAVAGCTFVAGTGTLTYRKPEQPVIPLPSLSSLLEQEFAGDSRIALAFGAEKHGLTRDDLSRCNILVEIPTDIHQPSMNLGQAVAVCLYELASRSPSATQEAVSTSSRPSSESLDRLTDLIEETMRSAGYSPRSMQAANQHDLRLMVRRLALSVPDTRRILGLFRRILWRLHQKPELEKKP